MMGKHKVEKTADEIQFEAAKKEKLYNKYMSILRGYDNYEAFHKKYMELLNEIDTSGEFENLNIIWKVHEKLTCDRNWNTRRRLTAVK
jgi:hypothetical protein